MSDYRLGFACCPVLASPVLASLLLAAACAPALAASSHPIAVEPIGGEVLPFVFEGDLRDLPEPIQWQPGDPIREIPLRRGVVDLAAPRVPIEGGPDPLLEQQRQAPPADLGDGFLTPVAEFSGIEFSGAEPPDTIGAVGPMYFLQAVNAGGGSRVAIFDKSDGTELVTFEMADLGSGNCDTGFGDPVIAYDHLAGRWVMLEFQGGFFSNGVCLYVSRTGDPMTGGWYAYELDTPEFPDYPKLGVWSDAYYLTTNESQPTVYALDRENALSGDALRPFLRVQAPRLGTGAEALLAASVDGSAPPDGAPNVLVRHKDDEFYSGVPDVPNEDTIELWEFSVDFDVPGNSSFDGPIEIAIAEIDSDLCSSFAVCLEQPTGPKISALQEFVMWRFQYRNFGSYEALVGNFATDVTGDDDSGIRWFEVRKSGGSGWNLQQEGTYSPSAVSRFMGSVAQDRDGNLALGYNVVSESVFPGLRYAGRRANDPLGTLPQGEANLIAGNGSAASNRYGDYSAMTLDPTDDCTFWFTGEYSPSNQWATRIAALRFDSCGPGGGFTLLSPDPGMAGETNRFTATGASVGGEVFFAGGTAAGSTVVDVPGCGSLTLSIGDQLLQLGTATADDAGAAMLGRLVPDSAAGRTAFFQAVDLESCSLSNRVSEEF